MRADKRPARNIFRGKILYSRFGAKRQGNKGIWNCPEPISIIINGARAVEASLQVDSVSRHGVTLNKCVFGGDVR